MKPLQLFTALAGISLIVSPSLYAGHDRYERGGDRGYSHHRVSYSHSHNNWVIPLVVGSVIGYALSSPQRESVTYVQSAPVVYAPEPVYQEQWVYFGDCDCQRKVLVKVR
jgi:hypothetical protein